MPKVIEQTLREAQITKKDKKGLRAVAVAIGPGLEKCLLEGIKQAQVSFHLILFKLDRIWRKSMMCH